MFRYASHQLLCQVLCRDIQWQSNFICIAASLSEFFEDRRKANNKALDGIGKKQVWSLMQIWVFVEIECRLGTLRMRAKHHQTSLRKELFVNLTLFLLCKNDDYNHYNLVPVNYFFSLLSHFSTAGLRGLLNKLL